MAKIYELTTNEMDGYRKFFVVGLKNDTEAKRIAKKVFGEYYWKNGIKNGISYYDTTENAIKRGTIKYWINKLQFLKFKKIYN